LTRALLPVWSNYFQGGPISKPLPNDQKIVLNVINASQLD